MKNPSVAIIIINWNSFKYTDDCLVSLEELDYDSFEIVIVDNASTDNSLAKLKSKYSCLHYIENKDNLGFTGGNNEGILYALNRGFEYLLLLNNDTIVCPDFLSILIDTIKQDTTIAAVQPKIFYNYDRSILWNAGGRYIPAISHTVVDGDGKRDSEKFSKQKEVDWITGCAFLVRTSVVKEVGMLNDLFFYGCYDDVEWSLRMRGAGYRLMFCPNSIIYHDVAVASKNELEGSEGFLKPYFHYLVNRNHWILIRLNSKHLFFVTSVLFQLVKFLAFVTYFTVRNRRRKLKAAVHGFIHGITKPLVAKSLNHKHYIQLYR
ncbi:MAG: glycosyltransferase family 2 protein [Oceanospirillaceae bacterium]|nr:glycosyltransferase family 2 protein [Oceanospirillaceae bacterium]